ncbi:A-kinase anchor protein 17A [Nerophis ophidion]|uniref:A-kinase anchor protein 17A n=1 Tax=Nerophis ophidion TaxID=159077 RepID=UPI002ADFB3D5|nr:A-kinase anchor protein 17A [Nerophis ophidion]XP_061735892.1 A-kinase anchor protein 17A [Nerophis ophidion]XP_061735893.1 A-kinase anchor protein 17A [Nerophis ophidion]XP_061735894.1 A-kinase anchor protein 17A [Nerophis ophidion]
MTTIVHDTTEAVCLAADYNIYLKPIAKMTVSVTLPQLKLPGKSISNWEVMERVKAMVVPDQFSTLRISKSTMDFIRFEGEVENKTVVKSLLKCLDGKSIKLSGFTDVLKVRAVENKVDFPTRHDWDSFFRDAKDMNETLPGERPDTIHLEGLPCRWFNQKQSNFPDRPSEKALIAVFEGFGKVRNVDIPMLDPYREDMLDKNFNTFSFGGHLNFEAYVQYQEYDGFTKAMDTLRGMKLMLKGDDGKAVACNIKVTFDTTKHLSDSAIKKRNLERLKLQELEKQREEQKRRKREEEERRKEQERKQKEQEEEERERKKEEKQRKREQKLQEREERRNLKRLRRQQEEEQKKLQMKIAMEERRLLLAQRNLESIRIIAELLARAKAVKQQQLEKERAEQEAREKQEKARQEEEVARRQQLEASRRRKQKELLRQQEELLRVELEKERALELQRREKELREKLLSNMLKKSCEKPAEDPASQDQAGPAGSMASSDAARQNVTLVVLGQVNGVKAAEGMSKTAAPAEIPRKSRGTKEKKGSDDVKKKESVKSGLGEENARRRGSRRRRSSGDRRRSTSRHGTSSRRRRNGGRRSHNHYSRSASSSRDRSRSSSGRSYSRGKSRMDSRRKYSRGSSRSSSRGRDRSHHSRGYRRHSHSRDRSHPRR